MNILHSFTINDCLGRARLFLLMVSLALISDALGADLMREKRMAEEIQEAILDGEPVWLEAGPLSFLGIYTEALEEPLKANIIILHGRGYHPDWAEVANPLRVGLAERGWNTLSLQMPVLKKDAKYFDYVPIFEEALPRINAGIEFLHKQNDLPVILIAHSCGAHMAMAWVRQHGDKAIDAYVGIGMGATDYGQPMLEPFPLDSMKVPVLDIYGAGEFPAVIRMAPDRLRMMRKAGNPLSEQVVVPDADHYFHDRGDPLLDVISGWLSGVAVAKGWTK
jgi:pimeloyl-ACP methyl ester carboxylesterase